MFIYGRRSLSQAQHTGREVVGMLGCLLQLTRGQRYDSSVRNPSRGKVVGARRLRMAETYKTGIMRMLRMKRIPTLRRL